MIRPKELFSMISFEPRTLVWKARSQAQSHADWTFLVFEFEDFYHLVFCHFFVLATFWFSTNLSGLRFSTNFGRCQKLMTLTTFRAFREMVPGSSSGRRYPELLPELSVVLTRYPTEEMIEGTIKQMKVYSFIQVDVMKTKIKETEAGVGACLEK